MPNITCECCGQAIPVDAIVIERHDLDRPAFAYTDLAKRGTEPTFAEQAREKGHFGRIDLCVINVGPYDSPKFTQLVVEPGFDDEPRWNGARKYLTRAQITEIRRNNIKFNQALVERDLFEIAYRYRR